MTSVLVIGAFFVLLVSGLPITFVLGIMSIIMLTVYSSTPLAMIPDVMFNSINSFTLMSVPFFVIAAQFMQRGGVSKYLIKAADCYVRHFWGGLAIVCVIGCMIFAAVCGSSVATALAMSVIVVPAMIKGGYPPSFATGVVAASGTMGIMIPPSVVLILYGIITEQSIPRLFLAGIAPGLLEGVLYIGWISFYSRKKGFRGGVRAGSKETVSATIQAVPALLMPVIILGGIYSGIVTVTEAAALAAVAAIFISIFIYREVKTRELLSVTADAMKSAGMIMIIITTASVFGHCLTEEGVPAKVVEFASRMNLSAIVFLILINIFLLFLGTFLEVVSIMLITLPIMIPVLQHLGIDLIHFGIIFTVNMEVAMITPPVGLNLFVLSGASRVPLHEVVRGVYPFVILGFIQILIVTYVPEFCLFIPNLIMPK